MKKFFALSIAMLLATTLFGQNWMGGPRIGFSLSRIDYRNTSEHFVETEYRHMLPGFNVGGVAIYMLNKGFEIETDFMITTRGDRTNYPDIGNLYNVFYYLDIPVKVNYQIGLARTGIFFGAGPVLSFMFLQGNYSGFPGLPSPSNVFDLGIELQLGVRAYGFQLSTAYNFGLINITWTPDYPMYNQLLTISLAYLF